MEFANTFRIALDNPNQLEALRQAVIDLRVTGIDKALILAELEALRRTVEDRDEDVILEVMDFLVGNCSPHMRID